MFSSLLPSFFQQTLEAIRLTTEQSFSEKGGLTSIKSLFFLRFVLPSLVIPAKYKLVEEVSLNEKSKTALKLISKLLHCILNGVEDSLFEKEPYLLKIKPLFDVSTFPLFSFLFYKKLFQKNRNSNPNSKKFVKKFLRQSKRSLKQIHRQLAKGKR